MSERDHECEDSLISALADGELRGEEFSRALDQIARSEQAMTQWRAYHVVGEVLRGDRVVPNPRETVLLERLRARLDGPAAHALQLAPAVAADGQAATPGLPQDGAGRPAANDPARRWRWLAAAASVVALATVGWHVLTLDPQGAGRATLAVDRTVQPTEADAPAVMLRDPRLDELMAAHRQFGGTSALQMPSGFLRNATFGPQADRNGP